jgi:hypothetical protein
MGESTHHHFPKEPKLECSLYDDHWPLCRRERSDLVSPSVGCHLATEFCQSVYRHHACYGPFHRLSRFSGIGRDQSRRAQRQKGKGVKAVEEAGRSQDVAEWRARAESYFEYRFDASVEVVIGRSIVRFGGQRPRWPLRNYLYQQPILAQQTVIHHISPHLYARAFV